MSGEGLDREAVRRRAEARMCSSAADALALLDALEAAEARIADLEQGDAVVLENARLRDALEAAEARLAESVPRSALVQVGWLDDERDVTHPLNSGHGGDLRPDGCECVPIFVLRTEGGAS